MTNKEDVSAGGKPNLKGEKLKKVLFQSILFTERGPYVFIEHREKKNLAWNETDSIKFGTSPNHRIIDCHMALWDEIFYGSPGNGM